MREWEPQDLARSFAADQKILSAMARSFQDGILQVERSKAMIQETSALLARLRGHQGAEPAAHELAAFCDPPQREAAPAPPRGA